MIGCIDGFRRLTLKNRWDFLAQFTEKNLRYPLTSGGDLMSELLKQAIDLIKAGDKDAGGKILVTIVKQEPTNELAWLWLSVCVKTNKDKRYCLKQALKINPSNSQAIKALQKISASDNRTEKPTEQLKDASTRLKDPAPSTTGATEKISDIKKPHICWLEQSLCSYS